MSLNCAEIEKVISYFPQTGFIKRIFEIDKFSLIINIFDKVKEYFIFCSIKDGYNRICLAPKNENFNKKSLRFSQSLNSSIKNGKIIKIYQYNYSRIVLIEIEVQNSIRILVLRLWGNGSNILLLDHDNKIIECLRRMPKRGEWPNQIFNLPDKTDKNPKNNFTVRKEFLNGDLNNNIYRYYNDLLSNEKNNKDKNNLIQLLKKEIKFLKENLRKENDISEDKENLYKKYGEFLKINLYRIKKGDSNIEVDDFQENKKISIPLDIKLTPSGNIKKYFNMYKKVKNSRIIWENERELTEKRLYNLEKYIDLLNNLQDNLELSKLEDEIRKSLNINSANKKNTTKKITGRHYLLTGGYNAYVSKSAKESFELLNTVAKGNDYWFHIRDYPGSHVIVKKMNNKEIDNKTKIEASHLAAYYSKCKNPEYVDIYFSQVKYLHKQKGGPTGLVFPVKEKNIKLKYNKDLIKKILNR